MKRLVQLVALVVLTGGLCLAGEVIDRIVAKVNRDIILQSDWDDAIRYEALMEGRAAAQIGEVDARAVLDRLIDQTLLRQQMTAYRLSPVTADEINDKLAEVRKQFPGAETDQGWRALLDRYDLTEADVRERVTAQLQMLEFIDLRLRPSIRVPRVEVETYYREQLLPQLGPEAQRDKDKPPSAEVSAKIREILRQQKLEAALNEWLKGLRAQSDIHLQLTPGEPPTSGKRNAQVTNKTIEMQ